MIRGRFVFPLSPRQLQMGFLSSEPDRCGKIDLGTTHCSTIKIPLFPRRGVYEEKGET
jgi:hypothetical protein